MQMFSLSRRRTILKQNITRLDFKLSNENRHHLPPQTLFLLETIPAEFVVVTFLKGQTYKAMWRIDNRLESNKEIPK